jgi:outer membrane protein TolC
MAPRNTKDRAGAALALALSLSLFATPAGASEPELDAEDIKAAEVKGPGDGAITWDELIADVERTNPLMKAAKAGLGAFEAQLSQAEWAWFPTFKLEAAGTVTPEITGNALRSDLTWDRVGYFFTATITLVQPIYTFGKIATLKRAARHGVAIGHARVEAARWELRYRSAQAYNGILLARELNAILEEGTRWLDKAEKRMARMREEDSDDYDQSEHLRLKVRVAEFFQLEAENMLVETTAREGLRQLLGRAPGAPVDVAAKELRPLQYELAPLERYVAIALKGEPGLRAARDGAAALHALHDNKRAEMLPDLVLLGTASLADANRVDKQHSSFATDPYHAGGVGAVIGLRWNLDVPQRVLKASQAGALARQADEGVEATRRLLRVKLAEIYQNLQNKRRLIKIFLRSQKAAQGWLSANWDLYEDGFGEFRDVMDSLVQFYGKKVAYLQIVHDHNLLVYDLSRAIGADITTLTPAPDGAAPAPDDAAPAPDGAAPAPDGAALP